MRAEVEGTVHGGSVGGKEVEKNEQCVVCVRALRK